MLKPASVPPYSLAACLLLGVAVVCPTTRAADRPEETTFSVPAVLDERLELTLWASDPDIVTPIGIAIDGRDRVFVLESHTHSPPSGYPGPDRDRIKILADTDGDGRMDRVTVYADGFEDGMNLRFSKDGILHLVEKNAVWALHDRDNDGVAEERRALLRMVEPRNVYDHAGLLGIAFSKAGWMYVSRGNVGGSAWRIEGTDGSFLEGYGDGGNIVRCRPDGSDLQKVATGFWNPFGLIVDTTGRVLATDNDPDSRGPNRLLHIVEGGDFGYKALYGGSGLNPYLSWNGELPGTLPYIAGLGESPTDLMEAGLARLPADYASSLLVAVWEESNIVKVDLESRGASLAGRISTVVQGGRDFRPVSFAVDSRGDIFFTDWVKRVYPNHGQGRIWHLAARDSSLPRTGSQLPAPGAEQALRAIHSADTPAAFAALEDGFRSADPFVRNAALVAAQKPVFRAKVLGLLASPDRDLRLGALLALRRAGPATDPALLKPLLADTDVQIRRMALIWAGESALTALRADLDLVLSSGPVTAELLDTYLETLRHLEPAFVEGVARRISRGQLPPRPRYAQLKSRLLADNAAPAATRTAALRFLNDPDAYFDVIAPLADERQEAALRLEAVRTLGRMTRPEAATTLLRLAQDRSNPSNLRADAVYGLTGSPDTLTPPIVDLLADPDDTVRTEAARALRSRSLSTEQLDAVRSVYRRLPTARDSGFAQQLATLVELPSVSPGDSATVDAWLATLGKRSGDLERGRRVFFSPQAQCVACHVVDNIGGIIGPNLTNIGASKTREQLIRAILEPSAEIAPDWQGWFVNTRDGQTHYGRQIDVKGETTVELMNLAGEFDRFTNAESWGVSETSLMPAGLENSLTRQDFADLIAYLESLD
jgi:putative membrane-bound dehydrogenase-like protein